MFYEKIIISGCKRFSVSGRYYVEVRPTEKVQIILGTNGSGKTSLAQLGFSPLPIEAKWMKPGGFYTKEGTYKGHRYILKGNYDKKPTFTFIKDGEVLLEDGNITTYLDLVRLHLDYDKWLHELLVGRIRFTDLTPQARQDLLSKVSKSDFTRAFYFLIQYKKLNQHYSSIVKFFQGRINEESVKLLDHESKVRLLNERDKLQTQYEEVQSISIQSIQAEPIDTTYRALLTALSSYFKTKPTSPLAPTRSAINERIASSKSNVDKLNGQIELINKEINDYQQKIGLLDTDNEHMATLMTELAATKDQLSELSVIPGNIPEQYLRESAQDAVEAILYALGNIPSELPTPEQESALRSLYNEKEMFLNKCHTVYDRIVSELNHYAAIEVVKCPSCHTEFKPGVDPDVVKVLNERKEKGIQVNLRAEQEFKDTKENLADLLERKATLDQLHYVSNKYKNTYPGLFQYIQSCGGLNLGKELIAKLQIYKSACSIYHKRTHLLEKIQRLEVVTAEVTLKNKDRENLSKGLDTVSKLLTDMLSNLADAQLDHNRYVLSAQELDKEESMVKDILNKAEAFYLSLDNELEAIKDESKKEALRSIVDEIANINRTINEQEQIETLIRDFENQLDINEKKTLVTKEIVNALSPKTGLIAEQISINIGSLLKGLNQLIDKVWGYPLEIRMGTVGDNGLDYKFPMYDSDGERDDVSEGSDSMIEMVNRAVVLMAYYSMDISDMPLFLDEPGRTFDKVHKLNLIPLIRDLSDSVKFSQIVLISHSEDVQTAFPNSETIILDERNINYPHAYNEHVSFIPPES